AVRAARHSEQKLFSSGNNERPQAPHMPGNTSWMAPPIKCRPDSLSGFMSGERDEPRIELQLNTDFVSVSHWCSIRGSFFFFYQFHVSEVTQFKPPGEAPVDHRLAQARRPAIHQAVKVFQAPRSRSAPARIVPAGPHGWRCP